MARSYGDDYLAMLRAAIRRAPARQYALESLDRSLSEIGIDSECQAAILKLLLSVLDNSLSTAKSLAEAVDAFQNDWRRHLDRVYFGSYEIIRWEFVKK